MCGINGFNWNDKSLVKIMNDSIKHRGPDDEGVYFNKNVSLGHRRLSILDISKAGHQPMFYSKERGASSALFNRLNIKKSRINIVYNGEIYNFNDIKKELLKQGYKFTTKTDTEVILASYLEWGVGCVRKFNGMWAFCIYDQTKDILFMSRDRIGIKPLYYYFKKGKFIFSSEIKGILATGVERIPNESAIFDFLYYNFRDHEKGTFFKDIEKVGPGENLIFKINEEKIKKEDYYSLKGVLKKGFKKKDLKKLIEDSIKLRLVSDVMVNASLSGGLDSSTIVCMMKKLQPKKNFKVFSLIFPGRDIDESKFQKIVEDNVDVARHTTSFDEEDLIKDLEDFIFLHEEPLKSFSQYGQYKIMELAKLNHAKVLLDGQGADEILAGYDWFYGYSLYELFLKMKWIKLTKEILCYKKRYGNVKIIGYFLANIIPNGLARKLWRIRMNHINYNYFKGYNKRRIKEIQWNAKTLNKISFIAITYSTLPELLNYEDKNSMRWSIESRVPFCDYNIIEYLLKQPAEQKIDNAETKIILRKSMEGILPEEIRLRKDKIGFATPDKELLKNDKMKKAMEEMLSSHKFQKMKYWNYKVIKEKYVIHLSGKKNHSRELFKIFLFFKWWERFIEDKKSI